MTEDKMEIVRIHMRDNYDVAPWEWDNEELELAIYDLITKKQAKNNEVLDFVMWRCTKNLFMDSGEKVFTKGKLYKQIEFNSDSAIDDKGDDHVLGEWSDFFIAT